MYCAYIHNQPTSSVTNRLKLAMLCGCDRWSKPLLYLFLPLIIILVRNGTALVDAGYNYPVLLAELIVMANNVTMNTEVVTPCNPDKQLQNPQIIKAGTSCFVNSYDIIW